VEEKEEIFCVLENWWTGLKKNFFSRSVFGRGTVEKGNGVSYCPVALPPGRGISFIRDGGFRKFYA
jgi:hypothetical protein